MNYFKKKISSGVFVSSDKGLIEYKGDKGNGSIISISNALGYHIDQVYSPAITDSRGLIYAVVMEIFTRNIVFVLTKHKVTFLTQKDVNKYLGDFSVAKEFNNSRLNDILNDGINNGSFTVEFLEKILKLKNVSLNGMFYSDRIKAYLYFTNGILTDFHFNDGLFPYAKDLQQGNKTVFKLILDIANKYWPGDDFNAQREINIQCEAWANIPEAFGNQYLDLHRTENGGANLHMIRVCHYNYPIDIEQFTIINKDRYQILNENSITIQFQCGLFAYIFEKNSGKLLEYNILKKT